MKKRLKKKKLKNKKEIFLSNIIDQEIKDNELRVGFSKKILELSEKVSFKKPNLHENLTHIPFVTIDGDDSKDFDDAVWAEEKKDLIKIMVAIADVSFFIDEDSPIDLEARKRGNSFYFPDRVLPMFPKNISNNICSLVPQKERACVVIQIDLFKNGKIKNYKIKRAIIKSHARLTYKEVDKIFTNEKNKFYLLIKNLFRTYKVLREKSSTRGKINFNSDEFSIEFQENQNFIFKKKENLHSYKVIEELMILANNIVAEIFIKEKKNTIFRNHEKPSKEKIIELKKTLNDHKFKALSFFSQSDFNNALEISRKKGFDFINNILLKSQSKAFYEKKNKGHFGLALKNYTHFTSPIRRYSDLIVHRDLLDILFKKKKRIFSDISEHLTLQEKKADFIERNIIERACSIYLKKIKKKIFVGIIDGIESFGIFIKCIDYPFSALARVRLFSEFNFKKKNIENQKYEIGQLVEFKIKRNNIYNGKILAEKVCIIEKYERYKN
tara:strand:+ start:344 stop:1834 length:1491 start_codon:yes stop_codon:yes gene_type:complete